MPEMNKPTPLSIAAFFIAFAMALSSIACGGDPANTDSRGTQLDSGTPQKDTTTPPPEDTSSPDDARSEDAGQADTSDISDSSDDAEDDVAPLPTMFLADGIELVGVQAFQTVETTLVENGTAASSDVPLIAGRETLVRVLVSPELVSSGQGWTPREVTAQLVLIEDDTGESQTLTDTLEVSQASQPDQRNSALEIRVPEGVITPKTSASIRLVGDGQVSVDSATESAARWPRDGSAMALAASDATGLLHVVLVPMRYDTDGSGRLPDTSTEQLARFEDTIGAIYPAHELLVEVRQPISWTTSADFGDFNRELRSLKQSDGAEHAFYYGIIRPTDTFEQYCSGSCTTGQSFTVSNADGTSYRVGSGLGFSGQRWAWTLVHELGHMHGRGHAPCGVRWWSEDHSYPYAENSVGVWGWDRRTDSLFAPEDVTDFMGYCDELWVSDYTYLGLLDRMREANALQQTMSLVPTTTWRYINWSRDDEPKWGRLSRESDPSTGEWATATFVDGANNTLQQVQVPLIRYAHDGERSVLVPEAPERAVRVQVDADSKAFALPLP
jgi:hypothetical protein